MVKRYSQKNFQSDMLKLQNFVNETNEELSEMDSQDGGSTLGNKRVRHFKLIEADKKEMNIGYVKINESGSPLSAAKKLFKSLCHHKNLNGDSKLKVKSSFTIQETTQDSKKKIYGPYVGSWKKLTEKEQKEAARAGIQFKMRSVVKLVGGSKKDNEKEQDNEEEVDEESTVSSTLSLSRINSLLDQFEDESVQNKKNRKRNNNKKIAVGG